MPIYEYQCNHCGHQFEKIQRISDNVLKSCPECKQDELRKLISSAAFQLKGSGWYVTDFKGDNKGNVKGNNKGSSKAETPVTNKPLKSTTDK